MELVNRAEYRITVFHPLGAGRMLLRFQDGTWAVVDFADLIARGNLFSRLSEDNYMAQARIMESGYFMQWPDELDIGADSLWRRGRTVSESEASAIIESLPSRVA